MRTTIQDLEQTVYNETQQISALSSSQELKQLARNAEKFLGLAERQNHISEEQLRIGEEYRDIGAEQLSVQKRQLQNQENMTKKALIEKEEECLQLFRLQEIGRDESYEWYKNRVEERVKGTCRWTLSHDHFIHWLKQDSGLLLVSADPGCGKSVLAKYLVDHKLPRSNIICYFFFKDQLQNTLKQAFCALLHQLLSANHSLIRYAMPEFSKNGPKLVDITAVLWNILDKAAHDPETGPLIFVLDALDECKESDFIDLVRMLKDQFREKKDTASKVKFLLTSRPYEQITSEFQELIDAFPHIRIPGEEESERISEKVNCVIKYRVDQLAKEKELNKDIKNHLEQQLLKVQHRTYLWVYLVFDYLKQGFKKTKTGVENSLTTLPETVNQAYDKILSKSRDEHKVRKTLAIILAAVRPLTLEEMNIAVNIESSSSSVEDLDLEEERDFRQTLRNWCGLFVSIYRGKVHFLHQTAREFLLHKLSPPPPTSTSLQPLHWYGSITLEQAHSTLAEICISYLNFRDFEDMTLSNCDDKKNTDYEVFHNYSAMNWATHFRQARFENERKRISKVLRICDSSTKRLVIWLGMYWRATYSEDAASGFTTLMIVSYFGVDGAVELLLNRGAEINIQAQNMDGETALYMAAWNGHETVVRLLLDRGAEINTQNKNGWTALYGAASGGHETIVRLLLDRGAEINIQAQNKDPETALDIATWNGDEAVVLLLLDKGAEINIPKKSGWTALHGAIENRHEAVIRLLLNRKAEVNFQDNDGRTALHKVAANGDETVVRLLLDKGAEINIPDEQGWTALHWAAENGHEAVVRLLLDRRAEVNIQDNYGETALHKADENGHETVVQLLLDKEAATGP